MSRWIQSLLLSNKMNDFICQTSNKTYPHVSTVKLDFSISCGTPDLDAHAEKMGNPVVVFHDVATDCGQQMALYVVNYLLLLLLKHHLHHHGVSIKKNHDRFCLLLGVSSDCAWPIAGQVTSVAWPVIGWAQTELTLRKRQKMGPDSTKCVIMMFYVRFFLNKSVHGHLIFITEFNE